MCEIVVVVPVRDECPCSFCSRLSCNYKNYQLLEGDKESQNTVKNFE